MGGQTRERARDRVSKRGRGFRPSPGNPFGQASFLKGPELFRLCFQAGINVANSKHAIPTRSDEHGCMAPSNHGGNTNSMRYTTLLLIENMLGAIVFMLCAYILTYMAFAL